jgi:glycine/D-amino acid oxidase-like deaminating enzyme
MGTPAADAAPPRSLWWDTLDAVPEQRPALDGDRSVDVAIVGGGFTGLWTARELLVRDPSLSVLVIEAAVCGFGASGRNGGWASALFAKSDEAIAATHGRDAALAMRAAMRESIDAIGAAAVHDGIACDFVKGGTVTVARGAVQLERAKAEVAHARSFGDLDLTLLGPDDVADLLHMGGASGGTFTPHCASIHPAKLVRGLAASVERLGGVIVEGTAASTILPRRGVRGPEVHTSRGVVSADVVVRATEAWTSTFAATRRTVAPLYSLMVATEPLSATTWASIGLDGRPTFADFRHLIIYGQRTADGRLAFGGRGAPYHFGSRIRPTFDQNESVASHLRATLLELFPALEETTFTHHWGGPLGVARDWWSSVSYDRSSGLAAAGGYVGDGVTTSNLAGRTLADLICGLDTPICHLPWVDHRSPKWEPEPLRYLGINAGLLAAELGDRTERSQGRASKVATTMQRYLDAT